MSREFSEAIGLVADVFRLDTEWQSRGEWLDYLDIIADLLIAHAKDKENSIDSERLGWIVGNEVIDA